MSSSTAHKFPIPRIPSTNTTKTAKQRGKTVVERTATKREAERARNKTRVNIGVAYERWRELRDLRNLKSDAEMATFLIDSYENLTSPTSSTPCKRRRNLPLPPASSIHSETLLDRADDFLDAEDVEDTNPATTFQSMDTSISPQVTDIEVIIEEEFNDIRNSTHHDDSWHPEMEMDDGSSSEEEEMMGEDSECSDDSDIDYVPYLCVRPDVNPHGEHRPETQDQDHRAAATDETTRRPEPKHSSSHDEPQKKPSKQCQRPHRLKKNYDCPTCGRVFSNNMALRRHLVIHSGKRPFKCFICGRGFTQRGNLKTHMKVHKGELPNWTLVQEKSPSKESPAMVHVCGECGMDFPQKQQLEKHHQSHKKPYGCADCGKTFKNEYYFKIHKRIHSGDSPFLCSECGKSCFTADSLKKHELTHTGEKNFHCDQCGRSFSQSSHLNVHRKTHTGERPHLCSICGKSYSKASILKVHLRVHTGEKPYTCEKCGKCFYYSQGYQKHLKIHDKKPKPQTKPLGRPKQQPLVVNNQ